MKKIFSALLSFVLVLNLSMVAFAAEPSAANVTIQPGAEDIPQEIVDDIVKSYPNNPITIYNWVEAEPETTATPYLVFPGILTKTTTGVKVLHSDKFVISVAKGSTKKLASTWKASLSATCSDPTIKARLSLGATIERSFTTEITFSGPPEGSRYNSRKYGVKFYQNKGTFKETGRATDMGNKLPDKSGTWTSPHSYAEYSIDLKV